MRDKFKNLKFLIVEDNEWSIMFYKSAFKRTGAEILLATNGEQAVEIVKANPDIDIILMDINMPKMDGITATKAIKKMSPTIPLIIQTAYVLDFNEAQCYESGCDFFIEKPVRLTVLFEAINKLINKK